MQDHKAAIAGFPIRRWLSEVAGIHNFDKNTIRADCPHCGKKLALAVFLETKTCKCYACYDGQLGGSRWKGYGGLPQLISLFENVSYSEAFSTIYAWSNKTDIPVNRFSQTAQLDKKLPDHIVPLAEVFDEHLAVTRLKERGLERIRGKLFACIDGKYDGRWVIPVYQDKEFVGFEAKAFKKGLIPKSLYPTWMHKSGILYLTDWDPDQDFAVITESVFDAETLGVNAIGIFGSTLGMGQFVQLLNLKKTKNLKRLVWFLDADAWKKQAIAIIKQTRTMFQNYVIRSRGDEDPNSLGHEECWKRVSQAEYVDNVCSLFLKRQGNVVSNSKR
jgi:hypothetical protein